MKLGINEKVDFPLGKEAISLVAGVALVVAQSQAPLTELIDMSEFDARSVVQKTIIPEKFELKDLDDPKYDPDQEL